MKTCFASFRIVASLRLFLLASITILSFAAIPHTVHAQPTTLLQIERITDNPVFTDSLYFTAVFSEPVSASTNTIIVTSLSDIEEPNDGMVTLREAMIAAHEGGIIDNGESINKDEKVTIDLSHITGTILLTSRLPAIDKDLSIYGHPSLNLTIDGNNQHRIFFVRQNSLVLENLILQNGRAKGGNASNSSTCHGGGGGGMGGAIFVNKHSRAECENIHFIANSAIGGDSGVGITNITTSGTHIDFFFSAGGGFYGDAPGYPELPTGHKSGGSGGYLGDEGKGGTTTHRYLMPKFVLPYPDHNGGFGGGGSVGFWYMERDRMWTYVTHILGVGGDGGFGGGAGAGEYSWTLDYYLDGNNGTFGGSASHPDGYEDLGGGGAGLGGAIFVREHGELKTISCVFKNNTAQGGLGSRGLRYHGQPGQGKGGAIFVQDSKYIPDLTDILFSQNSASNSNNHFTIRSGFQDNNDIYASVQFHTPVVNSIVFDENATLSNEEIPFLVTFNLDVTGVDVTDFDFDTDKRDDTRVFSVITIDAQTYRVILKKNRGIGHVALKLIDDDSIRDSSGTYPLAFTGTGNGNFTSKRHDFFLTYYANSILPLTGALADYGIKIKQGIELSIRDVNANSYSNGFVLESNIIDHNSSSESLQEIINTEKNNHQTLALIGGAVSENTLQIAELCSQSEIPLFSPTSTATLLADKEYTAHVVPLDNYQIDALHEVMTNYTGNQFFLIAEDSPYGRSFMDISQEEGFTMTGSYLFPSHSVNSGEILTLLSQTYQSGNPTIVIAAYENDANQILHTLAGSDIALLRNAPILLTDAAATPKAIEGLPVFDVLKYHPTLYGLRPVIAGTQAAKDFASKFKNTHGTEPEWISYYSYDAVTAFAESLKNAAAITRQGIWETIPWMRFEGVTGTKTFDEKGNLYSAAYDLYYVDNQKWNKADTITVFQPNDNSNPSDPGAAKVVSYQSALTNTPKDFTYRLPASDPLISHLSGQQVHGTGWLAESLDVPFGGVLMAYYEDVERGLSTDNQPFIFEDGKTYYLTFNVFRVDQPNDAPSEGDILELTVKSVYRYQNGDSVTHFLRNDLLNQTVDFTNWPSDTSKQITIPVTYESAAPDGVTINNEDNRFHWEIKLLNAARQKALLTSVEIGTGIPTEVEDYMLH